MDGRGASPEGEHQLSGGAPREWQKSLCAWLVQGRTRRLRPRDLSFSMMVLEKLGKTAMDATGEKAMERAASVLTEWLAPFGCYENETVELPGHAG